MTPSAASLEVAGGGNAWTLKVAGDWTMAMIPTLDAQLAALPAELSGTLDCDWSGAGAPDLGAAWLLLERLQTLQAAGVHVRHVGSPPEVLTLLGTLQEQRKSEPPRPTDTRSRLQRFLEGLGRWSIDLAHNARGFLDFYGRIFAVLGTVFQRPKALRVGSIVRFVFETGITAVPIVALIAFLISVIVAYLGAQQLTKFGADIFVVDLVTVAVLRELGVLLTAIIVAGRSGSAFAAEIGVMQINEETDALRAMGMNPVELLTVPRILGLMIALPLLTVVADAMGLAGGALLSLTQLNIPWAQFTIRMRESIAPTTFWVGIIKAPVFAFLIAMVGTYRGMQVRSSARELGRLTTMAVVQAIFLVILADALFAILFVKLDI
jgi:phospholipid/cholesterol/gamma-HCH transport system permease protein